MMSNSRMTRRGMLRGTAGLAAAAMTSRWTAAAPAAAPSPREMIWDCHGHINGPAGSVEERVDWLLRYADRMGVERMVVCLGTRTTLDPSPEQMRQQNDDVLRAVAHAPDRLFGFVYLSAKHPEVSLRELDRCVRDGPMVGVKFLLAAVCTEPRLEPVVQRIAELKVPVLACSQLSRSPERREDKRPVLSDLRESGSIEAEADVVGLLYRPSYYAHKDVMDADKLDENSSEAGAGVENLDPTEINIAKHRNGPTGTIKLGFLSRYACFEDLETQRTE